MTKEKILKGKFAADKETQKYRRFQISGQGIVGTIYINKDSKDIPDRIELKKTSNQPLLAFWPEAIENGSMANGRYDVKTECYRTHMRTLFQGIGIS